MICLTIRQPWAWLILNAGKDIENRTWSTNIRGPILIHAAKYCTKNEYMEAIEFARSARNSSYAGLRVPPLEELPKGGIVGSVEIVDCVQQSKSPWFFGPYGFVLECPASLPFKPCKGARGFWNFEETCMEDIKHTLLLTCMDGLWTCEGPCGCCIDDLAPCGLDFDTIKEICRPGKRIDFKASEDCGNPECNGHDHWHIADPEWILREKIRDRLSLNDK